MRCIQKKVASTALCLLWLLLYSMITHIFAVLLGSKKIKLCCQTGELFCFSQHATVVVLSVHGILPYSVFWSWCVHSMINIPEPPPLSRTHGPYKLTVMEQQQYHLSNTSTSLVFSNNATTLTIPNPNDQTLNIPSLPSTSTYFPLHSETGTKAHILLPTYHQRQHFEL